MRKTHRHHHTDGMARAVGTSGSSASIWARTHRQWPRTTPWLEVWLKVRRSGRGCVPRLRPAAGGVEPPVDARRPLPGRHEVAARRYL